MNIEMMDAVYMFLIMLFSNLVVLFLLGSFIYDKSSFKKYILQIYKTPDEISKAVKSGKLRSVKTIKRRIKRNTIQLFLNDKDIIIFKDGDDWLLIDNGKKEKLVVGQVYNVGEKLIKIEESTFIMGRFYWIPYVVSFAFASLLFIVFIWVATSKTMF